MICSRRRPAALFVSLIPLLAAAEPQHLSMTIPPADHHAGLKNTEHGHSLSDKKRFVYLAVRNFLCHLHPRFLLCSPLF